MRIDVVTIFPGMFAPVLDESILKRAQERGLLQIVVHDLRRYTHDRRRTVDDRPYGGGPGMVMKPEPLFEAVEDIREGTAKDFAGLPGSRQTILMDPQGEPLNSALACELASLAQAIIVCGRYEGVDERVRQRLVDRSISIGDYVLTGGELPAMVLIDCVSRFVPGVIGNEKATDEESFSDGWLEYPQYTRPKDFRGMTVPQVLRSGSHEEIARWRREQAAARTQVLRPDLLGERQGTSKEGERRWTG
jgi:tRNA (guanine37-N1)-methyltransferase